MAIQLSYTTIDVFTETRFKGNPLAIVHIPKDSTITREQKFDITKEFNLSETVFLHEQEDPSKLQVYEIFTTTGEIPFAGIPTSPPH